MLNNNLSNAVWGLTDKVEESSLITAGASVNGGWTSNQLTGPGAMAKDLISNWPQLTQNSSSSSNSSVAPIGSVIEAENYVNMSGVKTEATTDGGGLNVGCIDTGDWMTYAINVPAEGSYLVSYRVASMNGGGSLSFEEAGGGAVYGTVAIPSTNGWQSWTTVKTTVNLTAGVHKFGIGAKAGGWNFNWFSITQGVK